MNAESPIVTSPSTPRTSPCPRQEGSIILGWLTKLVVTLSLLGLLAFDGIALVQAQFTVADHATTSAKAAADAYKTTKNVQTAYLKAAAVAAENGETVGDKDFLITPNTGFVTLTLHKTATTMWIHRIGFLKKYAEVSAEGKGRPPL